MSQRSLDRLAVAAEQNVKEKEYWLKRLSGDLTKSGFPYDRPAKPKDAANAVGQTVRFALDGDISSRLMELSKGSDVKLHMILFAALVVLLEKYTGSRDIIIGTPIYKQEVDIEFINSVLVIRTQSEEGMTFKELLLQVRQRMIEANEHQNYPIEILLNQLGLPSPTERKDFPLFDVVILCKNIHDRKYIQCDYIDWHILFTFERIGTHIEGAVEYDPLLYERGTIERIVGRYYRVLQVVLVDVDIGLDTIGILSEQEKEQILCDFNNTKAEKKYLAKKSLLECFEEQAEKTPYHVALKSQELLQDLQLTYHELDRKSNQLARFLVDRGIKPGSIVALMLERSLELMIGIIAVMKTGGVYLPIDPAYPRGRIKYMLAESGANVLLTYGDHLPNTGSMNVDVEIVDIFSAAIYEGDSSRLTTVSSANDPAYIIYTSGSTGRPKGVAVEHRNVIAYLNAFLQEFDITAADTALQQASCSFDAFVEEVFPLLFSGGKVAICPKYVLLDSKALLDFILVHDVTVVSVSPLLLNEIDKMPVRHRLRILISGGDVLKKEYIANLLKLPQAMVYNTYGPTEAAVCATYHRCSPEDNDNPAIGKPIAGYRVYILDRNNKILPPDIPGELCISGAGVARGYLNRPELSAERFTYMSYRTNESNIPGKLYKTGDLARWLPDGSIQFLGRIDNQVKVRGFRIELAEIENHLLKHEGVDAVLVRLKDMSKESGSSDMQRCLCAYIASHRELSIPGLKEYLSKYLPDYMIPSHYVLLEKIPLTANGKPDNKVLDTFAPISAAAAEYVAPESDMEIIIANIWNELLGLERVGIHDNFFDLGGNSMLLLKATNKLRETLNRDVSYMTMFQYTTIQSLADHLNPEIAGEEAADRYAEQADTLNRGKDRMKKLIQRGQEAGNG